MKKKTSIFIFWFILVITQIFNTVVSQEITIDTLKKYSSDSLKLLSRTHRYSNPVLAKAYAKKLFDRGHLNNDLSDIGWGYHQLGLVNEVLGNYKKSITQYNKGIEISKTINDSILLMDLYLVKGSSFLYLKEYEKVFSNYDSALYLAKKIKNLEFIIVSNINIAYLKKEVGLLEEALEIEKNNLKISKKVDFINKTTSVNLIVNLGETFLALEENDSAIYYNEKALEKSLLINNLEGSAYIYKNLGLAYYNKKEYLKSIRNLKEAIVIIQPFTNRQLLSELNYYKGRSLYKFHKRNEAIEALKKSEAILLHDNIDNESSILLIDTYKLLAEIYKDIGRHKESGDYFEKYVTLDKTRDASKIKTIGDLNLNNIQDRDETIATLSSKQKSQQKKYSTLLISSVISLFVFFIILIGYVKKSRKNKNAFQDLMASIEKKKKEGKSSVDSIKIDDEKAKNIINSLKNLEYKEFFLDSNFSLTTVAKKVKTNPTYLSKTINNYKNQKFQEYVNELRINYAINRLKEDKKFRSYSIHHIAKEVGYKSPNSFSKHFKNKTGIYPSFFISSIQGLQLKN